MSPTSWLLQVRNLTHNFLDFAFPPVCASCQKVGELLCVECQANIPWVVEPICPACGRILEQSTSCCAVCRREPLPLKQIRTAVIFQGIIPHIIHQMKYNGAFALAVPLADMMVKAWPTWQCPVDLVMPVPLHPKRQKKRGYNQSELIVKRFCECLTLPPDTHSLQRVRSTPPQVGLDAAARKSNVHGAFAVQDIRVKGKDILLVDDVCTTGATLAAATNVLLAAGANSVSAYCVARAM
jgi:competence protein ComFC